MKMSTQVTEVSGNLSKLVLKYVRSRDPSYSLPPFPRPFVWSRDPSYVLPPFPRPIVFTHIPKAAGTTLDRILRAVTVYQERRHLRVPGTLYGQFLGHDKGDALETYRQLRDRKLARVDVISGHLPYGAHDRIARDCIKITLLRDPLERCLSHYRFGVQRGGWGADSHAAALFASGALIDNCQVRQIAGMIDPAEACTVGHLQRAKDNLANRYDFVGTADRFDDFLCDLLTRLKLTHVVYTDAQVNALKLDPGTEEGLREEFAEFNVYDTELYDFARQMVDSRVPVAANLPKAGPAEEEKVLLVSEDLRFGSKDFSLLPAAQFEQVTSDLERQGVSIVRIG